ncbi:MAG TPA: SDR family oxidoreductase [Frankiaceae bacterium]|nr:SDR family oxidoreductase [Frankiaceae bacterium]
MSEQTVLVAGGAGAVGEGVVERFLAADWRVIVPSRSQARLDAQRDRLNAPDKLTGVFADVGTSTGASALRDSLRAEGVQLNAVVASIGGWRSGPLLVDTPVDEFRSVLEGNLTSHLVLAQAFLPMLPSGGAYTMVVGDTAEAPVRGAGPVSVAASAVLMLSRSLALESAGKGVRVNALVLGPVNTRRSSGRYDWVTAEEVGETALWLSSAAGRGVAGAALHMLNRPSV